METKSKLSNQKLIIILLVALIALLAIVLVVVLGRGKAEDIPDGNTPLIGYSTGTRMLFLV